MTTTDLDRIQREEHDKVLAQLTSRERPDTAIHFTLGWIEGRAGEMAYGKPAERLARIRGAIEAFKDFSAAPSQPPAGEPPALDTRDEVPYAAGLEWDPSREERP